MIMKLRQYHAGDILFLAGALADEAFLIKQGELLVYDTIGGVERIFATRRVGDIVGEIALIDGQRRSAAVRAITDCELIVLTRDILQAELDSASPLVRKLMESFLTYIRHSNAASVKPS
jgi:CRP-like cAMP-binding protein